MGVLHQTKRKKSPSRVGRDSHGRVDWNDPANLAFLMLVDQGLFAKVIARATGMTVAQVYLRSKEMGVSVTDRRNGKGQEVERIVARFSVIEHRLAPIDVNQARRKLNVLQADKEQRSRAS